MQESDKQYILDNIGKKSTKAIAAHLSIKERKVRKFLERQRSESDGKCDSGAAAEEPSIKIPSWPMIILIILLGFLAYANSLGGDFLYDDDYLIKDNDLIKSWSGLGGIIEGRLSSDKAIIGGFAFYRPLQILTYLVDYRIWGLDSRGFHLTNVVLHILAALMLFKLIDLLFKNNVLAFMTAAFFTVHPVLTEAVSYISGRTDPLSAVFLLASLVFYIKAYEKDRLLFCVLSVVCYFAALLSREASAILLGVIFLYHYVFKKEVRMKLALPLICVTVIYAICRMTVLKGILGNIGTTSTLTERLPGIFVALASYVRLAVLPVGLHMSYGMKTFSMSEPRVVLGIAILALFIGYAVYAVRYGHANRLVLFSALWFFITLLPVSNIFPLNAYMAEHWLYIPIIGYCLLLAGGVCYFLQRDRFRYIGVSAGILILSIYLFLTVTQNGYWKDSVTFFERTLRFNPEPKWRIYEGLGRAYKEKGQLEKAVMAYKGAIESNPRDLPAYNNLANAYLAMGRVGEAIVEFKKALAINPNDAIVYYNLSDAYRRQGDVASAQEAAKRAAELGFGRP